MLTKAAASCCLHHEYSYKELVLMCSHFDNIERLAYCMWPVTVRTKQLSRYCSLREIFHYYAKATFLQLMYYLLVCSVSLVVFHVTSRDCAVSLSKLLTQFFFHVYK